MPSKHPSAYTQAEVNVWLNSVGLGSKTDVFIENGIDGEMLVTLSEADLMSYFAFSALQARKFALSLDFAKSLAEGGDGGANSEQLNALKRENAELREEVANLKAINKELQDQLMPSVRAPAPPPQQYHAPAPAPPPQQYYAPAPAPPPQHHHHAKPAPVLVGAGGGALKGATLGAIGGAIAGDPAKGAAMGAAMGAAAGGMGGLAERRRERLARRF